jgi:hypothetical protein
MKTTVKLKWWEDYKEADIQVVCRVNKSDLLYVEAKVCGASYHLERNYLGYFEFKNPKDKEKLVREFEIEEILK